MSVDDLKAKIRDVPDFPEPGIVFKDIMPLLADPSSLNESTELLAEVGRARASRTLILGAEARGFILGAALAYKLGCGFVAARRPGKLPWKTGQRRPTRSSTARELARTARRRDVARPARARPRRRAGHGRHRRGRICDLAAQLGGEIVGVGVRDRGRLPRGPQAARRIRRPLADPLLEGRFWRPGRATTTGSCTTR